MKRSERRIKFNQIEILFGKLKMLDKGILTLDEVTEWLAQTDKEVVKNKRKVIIERAMSKGSAIVMQMKSLLNQLDWTHTEEETT